MKILFGLLLLCGIWFLASAATKDGLLPSGHGTDVFSEVLIGIGMIMFAVYMLLRKRQAAT